jgi:hypothetical protein
LLRGSRQIPVAGHLTAEADQLPRVLRLGRFEETPFEPGAERLRVLEAVVEQADLFASRRHLFVEQALAASVIGFAGGGLGQERAGPVGFCAGFVHLRAHLLQPTFEKKDAMRVGATGEVRKRVRQLLFLPHDRTTEGILSVVPAL